MRANQTLGIAGLSKQEPGQTRHGKLEGAMGENFTEIATRLVIQLGIILIAAKVGGEIAMRWFKVPPVLGELAIGIIIGPYAFGSMHLFGIEPFFPTPSQSATVSVSPELYSFAQVSAVVLLFGAGMDTDLKLFLRYAGPGAAIAVGGVILPFVLGAGATVVFAPLLFGDHISFTDPRALFMGAIMTATSVGITGRVLSDLGRLATPEGVTVLAAAVLDDVLGILVLTIVVGMNAAGSISLGEVALIGGKAIGFWVVLTGGGLAVAAIVVRVIGTFRIAGSGVAIAFALALLAAGLSESFGLAMIIGAYSTGLALSSTRLKDDVAHQLETWYLVFVPVFFVVMGMQVDVRALGGAWLFGLVITLLAIASKIVGCGLPALVTGFNLRGATRIGVGMLPRGEVALIIAGVGIANGIIGQDLLGVAILMTLVTTAIAPIALVPAFRSTASGRRGKEATDTSP